MQRWRLFGFQILCCLVGLAVGCSQPADSSGPKSQSRGSSKSAASGDDSPAHAVRMFLTAVRKNDDAEAGRWLTKLALEKITERKMSIAPPGSETAQFAVGEVEMVEGGAHVASTWSDVDADGNRQKEPIVWVVAKEPEGWRICGMATTLFEDKLPIVLNFEDPDQMAMKQQYVEAEAARRAAAADAKATGDTAGAATGDAAADGSGAPGTTAGGVQSTLPAQQSEGAAGTDDRLIDGRDPASTNQSAGAAAGPSTARRNVLRDSKQR